MMPEQQAAVNCAGRPSLGAASVARPGGEAPDDKPVVVEFASDGVKIEVAARPSTRPGHRALTTLFTHEPPTTAPIRFEHSDTEMVTALVTPRSGPRRRCSSRCVHVDQKSIGKVARVTVATRRNAIATPSKIH
jgi:hypothetical protein